MSNYNTAGPASIIISAVAAIAMIVATALWLPSTQPAGDFGICLPSPNLWNIPYSGILLDIAGIALATLMAFLLNKRHSFVKGAEGIFPTSTAIILASNPVSTSYFGTPVIMLIINLVCLDIMMKSYRSGNATTAMFAVATYLSLGSMVQYAFLPFMIVYLLMAMLTKVLRFKEIVAYLMGLFAPYWVALGLGFISFSDFRIPRFLTEIPVESEGLMLLIYISLGLLALTGLMMTLNNAMLIYSGNLRVRTFNNMINLIGTASFICMLADFDNFSAYTTTFCFAVAVQIANFFAIRHIPRSSVWFWSLLSLFILLFILMIIETTV